MTLPVAALAALFSTTFVVVPEESRLSVEVDAAGFAAPLGVLHDHRFVVEEWSGSVTFSDRGAFEDLLVVVEADSLRDTAKLSRKDRRTVERQVRTDVLDAADHPRITFRGTSLAIDRRQGDRLRGTLTGDLTIRGVTREVEMPIEAILDRDEGRLTGEGAVTVRQSSFGIEPYSRFLGAVAVEDKVTIAVTLTATAP